MVISDESIVISQLLGNVPGLPPKVCAYEVNNVIVVSVGPWRSWALEVVGPGGRGPWCLAPPARNNYDSHSTASSDTH